MPRRHLALALVSATILAGPTMAGAQEVLRFAVATPPQVHFNQQLFIPWAAAVSADSQGTLDVQMFFAGALGREGELIDLVQQGTADIALDIPAYYPGRFPLTDIAALPMIIDGAGPGSRALWSLYEQGLFGSTFDGLKVLAISTPPAATLLTTEATISVPSDASGLRIAGGGRIRGDEITAMGAAPVDVRISDLYQSLDRGVVDGAVTFYTAFAPFRLHEVGHHALDVPLGGSLMLVFMDQARFDALPEAARNAIDAHSGAAMSAAFGDIWDAAGVGGRGMLTSAGGTISTPDEAAMQQWTAILSPIVDTWIAQTEGGAEIVEAARAALAQ